MLFLTAFTFFASHRLFIVIACFWLMLAMIEWNWKERYYTLKENHLLAPALCFLGLYLMYLVNPLISENTGKAISEWEYQIWCIVAPICVMPLIPKLQRKELSLTMILFIISILICATACMAYSTYCYFRTGQTSFFFYTNATLPDFNPRLAFNHPSYFTLYETTAWIISVELFLRKCKWLKYKILKVILFVGLLLFPLHIILLQSKIGTVLFGFTLLAYIAIALNHKKRRLGATVLAITSVIAGIAMIATTEIGAKLNQRLVTGYFNFKQADFNDPSESSSIRVTLWKNAIEIGKGDVTDQLHEKAVEKKHTIIASQKFNCHNQYLQVWLGTGIIGLLLFIGIFGIALIICIRKRNLSGAIIIVIFSLNLLVECMTERYAGATLIPIATAVICSIPPTMLSSGKSASHSREALPSASCA